MAVGIARMTRDGQVGDQGQRWGWRQGIELVASLGIIGFALRYLVIAVHAAATLSLWTDEIYSVHHYSGKGPWTTLTVYDVANNHVFFNLLGSLTPGAGSVDPLHARFWSIVAVLATIALALYEFFRRRWYLAGALFVFVFCVNHEWLDLALEARGYGILGFCGVAASLWAWRYLETGRRRWLVALAAVTLAGGWSVPTFVFFAGPLWLGLAVADRTWKVVRYGAAAGLAVVVAYLPVQGQLRHQLSTYASQFGRQYDRLSDVTLTLKTYLYVSNLTELVAGALFVTALIAVLWLWPADRPDRDAVDAALVLLAAVAVFFIVCLILQTPAVRTTAFVVMPLTLAVLLPAGALLARLSIRPLVAAGLAVALILPANVYAEDAHNRFIPVEDWLGAGRYLARTFPAGTAVYTVRGPDNLVGYLRDHDRSVGIARFSAQQFDDGKLVVVDTVETQRLRARRSTGGGRPPCGRGRPAPATRPPAPASDADPVRPAPRSSHHQRHRRWPREPRAHRSGPGHHHGTVRHPRSGPGHRRLPCAHRNRGPIAGPGPRRVEGTCRHRRAGDPRVGSDDHVAQVGRLPLARGHHRLARRRPDPRHGGRAGPVGVRADQPPRGLDLRALIARSPWGPQAMWASRLTSPRSVSQMVTGPEGALESASLQTGPHSDGGVDTMSGLRTGGLHARLIIVLAVVLVVSTSCDWTQFRYDSGHAASSPDGSISVATVPSFAPRWAATTGGAVGSSPAVVGGVAYVGSDDHKLYAIDTATGATRWSATTGAAVESSPAVDNGTVYVGSDDHELYARRASDGLLLWSVTVDDTFGGLSSAPTVNQGLIWVTTSNGLYAFNTNGTLQRATPIVSSGPLSAPSIAGNLVFTASYADATLWAFQIDTGALAWSATVPGPLASCTAATSSPATSAGVVYVALCPASATPATSLFAYRATDGTPVWSAGSSALSTSPAVTGTSVYAASSSGHVLEAHDLATGALQWTAATGSVRSSPAVIDGVVYLGTDDGRLLAFDASGARDCTGVPETCTPLWSASTGGAVRSSPVVVDGTIYVGSDDQQLHAYSFPIGFTMSTLSGTSSRYPIVGRFGPDGRFYVLQLYGTIKAYTVARNGPESYVVTATEVINAIRSIPNHDDDGTLDPAVIARQVTGMAITGTAAEPVIYVASSDPRQGGGPSGTPTNLDTNSGVISRLTRVNRVWQRLDLVRGLPRSRENHSTNALLLDSTTNILYVAQGGNTNMGAPSHDFDDLPEYAYSGAILSVDLNAIGDTTYDLPTLVDEDHPTLTGPFGGDSGKHQAKITPGSPVQVYAPGFRSPFNLVQTESGSLYVFDNGANIGWGDVPKDSGPAGICTNDISEPGTDQADSLHRITGPGYYGGFPNPTRGNRANTFNTTDPQSPVPAADPIECVSRGPTNNGSIAQIDAPTVGMAEYTASNFGGQMKGDLLVAGFLGGIYRVDLSPDGQSVLGTPMLFPDAGVNPIDVAVRGDGQTMPGTVWMLDYTAAGTISVAEPNDYGG